MASEWRDVAIGELAEIYDGPHATPPKTETGPVFLGIWNLAQGRLDLSTTEHLSEDDYQRWTRRVIPQPGDLVFSYETRLGEAASIPVDLRCCLGRRMGLLRARPRQVDRRFLLYAYLGPQFQETLRSHTIQGSTVDRIPLIELPKLPIRVPTDIAEQRAIAHILGALDDKIELNRRMNETLEAVARAIFKSWFVDFDPARAKVEGRQPFGMDAQTAALFPNAFEDSPLGKIPKGWGTHPLSDVLSLDKGLSYKGQFLTEHGVPMVNLGCFLGRGRFSEKAIKKYSGEYKSRHVVSPRDLVLANTDITQHREVIGSPALVPPQGDLSELIFSHHVFAARFHEGTEYWKMFVYFLLLQDDFRARAAGFATGTTVLALPRDAVLNVRFPGAPRLLVTAFAELALPILEREWKSAEESRTLATLRDALLPKLISGELRVKHAERFIRSHG